jgi:hypothetical protein
MARRTWSAQSAATLTPWGIADTRPGENFPENPDNPKDSGSFDFYTCYNRLTV